MEIRPGDPIAQLDNGREVTVKEVRGAKPTRIEAEQSAMQIATAENLDAAVLQEGDSFVVVTTDEVDSLRTPDTARRPVQATLTPLVSLATGNATTGVTLRGRVPGSNSLNNVIKSTGAPAITTPSGTPETIAAAQIARLDAEAASQGLSPVERALRGVDAGAQQLANDQPLVAAALYTAEAARIRASLPEHAGDERTVLEFVADNLERRGPLYVAEGTGAARQAAGRLAFTANNTMRLAGIMEDDSPDAAALLKAVGADSYLQADTVYAHSVEADAAFATGFSQVYENIVDASFAVKINEASDIGNFFSGDKDELIEDRAKMKEVFAYVNRQIEERGIPFNQVWNEMFNDAHIGDRALLPNFATPRRAALFLRDNPISAGLLSPMADISRGLWEGNATTIDAARGRLIESLRENDQWSIAERVLEDFAKTAESSVGQTEAARLQDNQSSERWKARGAAFAEELPILIGSGLISGGAGWGVKALTYGSRLGAAARTTAIVGTELSTFVMTERLLSEAVGGKARDWSPGAIGRDLAIGAAGYGILRGLGKGWQAFRAAKPNLGKFGSLLRGNRAATAATEQSAARTAAHLETGLARPWSFPGTKTRHLDGLRSKAQGLLDEVQHARQMLATRPSGAARANLERALAEAEPIARKLEEYALMRPPSLPVGRAPTEVERLAHRQATTEFKALERQLRQELGDQIVATQQSMFAIQAELAGIKIRPLSGEAMQTDPIVRTRAFRSQHGIEASSNVGVAELSLTGKPASSIGPAASGRGAGSLERTGQYADEARNIQGRPGEHNGFRNADSEVQLLEQAALKLQANPNASGTLRLFTERPPCISCRRVMSRFMSEHPNIKLEVMFTGTRVPASVGITTSTAADRGR